MSRLPRVTGAEVVRALERAGFVVKRIRGSHHILVHPDGRVAIVPVHSGDTIGPGLLTKILRSAGIDRDELLALL